ncbi:DUF4430 domain-containing protein [Candidatus Parcubacteria bacterium]|nr:DUF4430 domain-containing protein [Candidatus Parcubacteria bacterium]
MKKKNLSVIMLLIFMIFLLRPVFSIAGVDDAITYLKAQAQDSWITQALAAAGETTIANDHLKSVSGTLATDYAKAILAVATIGEDPAAFGNIDYVAKLKTYYANNQMGDDGLINDDMWSILALASIGEGASNEALKAKDFILDNQNADGGWGYSVGGDSDTNDTAAAIISLLEAGVSETDAVIINAVSFLRSVQNADGGFGWTQGSNSDSGSDAWVICALNKLSVQPASWEKNGHNPVSHLESLQDTDGGYWWVAPGASDYNNKAMTTYAVIALSGKSFPVAYYLGDSLPAPGEYRLRVEGELSAICDISIYGDNALDLLINAADECAYTYNIEDTSYGPYLNQINNEAAEGMNGWLYFVNSVSPTVGSADYDLSEGDEVLFYYGEWGWSPVRLVIDKEIIDSGQSVNAAAEYFQDSQWKALEGAVIKGGSENYIADSAGTVIITLPDGFYSLYAEKDGFVRSNTEDLTVGDGIAQNISMTIEIEQGAIPNVASESLIFEVSPGQLDFGKTQPGQASVQTVILSNSGTVSLDITALVNGDQVFIDNTKINNNPWNQYQENLEGSANKETEVNVAIPENYTGSGVKIGELIFWAMPK